jgi:hypothetical protein
MFEHGSSPIRICTTDQIKINYSELKCFHQESLESTSTHNSLHKEYNKKSKIV